MKLTLEMNKLHWWYWTVSWLLVVAGLAGYRDAFLWVTLLAAWQIGYYRIRERRFSAFPVQVRLAVFLIFICGLFFPVLFWIPAVGLFARNFFNYCLTSRLLKLLPFNHRGEKLTAAFIRRTLFSPPTHGPLQ